ncbi:MAG: hypothetical protein J3R72DRAFT_516456 [Linnemannia gamsii]|nr:MAG: hypothetical protein J3R72DRAFT_516456 [Linnemannia gamsii]
MSHTKRNRVAAGPRVRYALFALALLDVLSLVHSTSISSNSPPSLIDTSDNILIPDDARSSNILSDSHDLSPQGAFTPALILSHPHSPAIQHHKRHIEPQSSVRAFADPSSSSVLAPTTRSTKLAPATTTVRPIIRSEISTPTQARLATTTVQSSSVMLLTSPLPSTGSPLPATTIPWIPHSPRPIYLDPVPPSTTDTFVLPTDIPRPKKPRLLTDFEFDTMWNPDPNTLRLGIILSLNAQVTQREATMVRKALSTIRMAVSDINEGQIIPGLNMSIIIRDSQDPSLYTSTGGSAAIAGAVKLISAKVGGVIGDIRSDLTKYEALMTSSVQIPQCSFASASATLSDQDTYPFFYRTIPTIIVLLDALLDVVRSMGWRRISLIYDINTLGWSGREYFSSRAQKLGIYILAYQPLTTAGVPFDPTYAFVKDRIRSSESRVQVLIATGQNQYELLHEMKEAGFFSPDYAWVTANDISSQLRLDPDVQAYDGLIMVDNGWELSGYAPYEEFLSKWLRLNPIEYPGAGDANLENNEGMAYSCVMMLAYAYRDLIEQAIPDPAMRTRQTPLIRDIIAGDHAADVKVSKFYGQKTYRGPSGPITLDQNGDRKEGYYIALSMQDGRSVHFGIIFSGNYTFLRNPFFKRDHPDLPSDAPPWALQNPRWDSVSGIIFGTLCIIGIILTLISAVLVVHFRDNIVIKAASPTFCLCELLGIMLVMIWCTLHIGIPTEALCIAQSFVLPIGVTLLAGSLTIKNYRIYRIFNSMTVMNQAFQTRLLLRWMALALFLCLVPMIVEMIVDPPKPHVINIRSIQWTRCHGVKTQVWWSISASIIPAILIIFGVFLAFKTRNVVFLWNEAKQISLVLYNVFFFTIIIVISLFFPIEIYLATFYISIVGIFFVALLALTVLFLPKFWSIWKNFRKPWAKDSHPSNQNQQRLSAGIGRLGSGGGGGGGGVGTLGRMPGDFRTATSNVRRQAGAGAGATAAAAATTAAGVGMGVDDSSFVQPMVDPITAESVLAPVTHPVTSIGGGGSNEKPAKHKRTFSVASLTLGAQSTQLDGNPLGAWMNSRVPHRGSEAAAAEEKSGTFMKLSQGKAGSEEEGSSNSHGDKEAIAAASETMSEKGEGDDATGTEIAQRPRSRTSRGSIKVDIPNEHYAQRTNNNRVEFAESSFGPTGGGAREGGVGREETDVSLDEPMRTTILAERTFGSSTSGAQRMLDCFVFLLPIRVLRSRITSLLSHWCMATLILIPEAHAFLAVDSTDGRSTSYLMLSMTQVHNEEESTIRVTACHAGTLLIRFSSQSRLDGWMSLFTEQDLQSLAARSNSTSSSGSYPPYTTGYNGNLPGGNGGGNVSRARRRSVAPEPGPDFINPRNFPFVAPSLGDSDAGGEGGDRGNVLLASDDESQRRSSWASRFGTGFSRFWHRKDSSKSTSGTSSQTAYDVYNSDHNVYHSGYHNDHNGDGGGGGGGGDEDGFATSRWSRAGGEWTSTDSNMSNSTPVGRQIKRPMKYQPAFGGASEVVVEDLEGEAQSPERAMQVVAAAATINATSQMETMPLKDQSLTNGIEALSSAGSGNDSSDVATGYGGVIHAPSQRKGSIASGRFGETLPSPMPGVNPPSLPPSMHAPSVRSHRGSVRSVARSDAPPTEEDDEDSDDLYDPEFGIGGNGRRRRNRPKLPSRLLTTQANPAVIPSAAVISAAAAAVSAGWSESDALAAAMASPGLVPITPGRSGGLTPTTPGISPNSPRYNRARHDSRVSMTSSLRASQYIRQGSVGEEHLSNGSGNSGHSNQGTLATVGASSIIANTGTAGNGGGDGGDGHTRRVFNDRVNNMSPVSNIQTKLLSASSQMLLSSQTTTPSSPITSTPTSRVSSVSSVIAPLATYPTSADINNNCPIESQDQPQQQQSQSPQPQL